MTSSMNNSEIQEKNRRGKTRELVKKTGDIRFLLGFLPGQSTFSGTRTL